MSNTTNKGIEAWFSVFMCTWAAALVVAVSRMIASGIVVASVSGCVHEDFPRTESCAYYMSLMRPVDERVEVPSLTPADFGIRIVVASDFEPLMGSSYPVPGGRMVWNVWIMHWYDRDRMGAVGRLGDSTECQWFDPL